jgi:hypothetical protein
MHSTLKSQNSKNQYPFQTSTDSYARVSARQNRGPIQKPNRSITSLKKLADFFVRSLSDVLAEQSHPL